MLISDSVGPIVTMNSNFASLKKQKLFSIRVKEIFEPIVLRKKGDGFLLFLKAFSWETDLPVTLGDFTVKKKKKKKKKKRQKLGREICI